MNDTRYWLWFVAAFRPGNPKIWEYLAPYRDIKAAYEAFGSGEHPALSDSEKHRAVTTHIEQCDSIIEYCSEKGYRIVTFDDENYPPLLRCINNPPAVLFCMGNLENFNSHPAVACVGTRTPSLYSVDVTKKICTELAKRDFAVVSGFALGLDSVAHDAVLRAGGCTAAVLACGLDVSYPKGNEKAKAYIAKQGVIISEYLPGTHADRYCFQIRNRVISGLGFGTLVTEAAEGSGALITALHAGEQGRAVFCVPPGNIFDKRYGGVIKFIREGAICTFSHLDILREYFTKADFRDKDNIMDLLGDDSIFSCDSRVAPKNKRSKKQDKDTNKKQSAKTDTKTSESGAEKSRETTASSESPEGGHDSEEWEEIFSQLEERERLVAQCLLDGSLHLDEICEITGLDSFSSMAAVTELEMLGLAELLPDRRYKLVQQSRDK